MDRAQQHFRSPLIASLLIHAVLAVCAFWFSTFVKPETHSEPKDVVWLDPSALKAPTRSQKQMVDSSLGQVADQAKEDAYLGEKNRIVKDETVSKAQNFAANAPTRGDTGKSEAQRKATAQNAKTQSNPQLAQLGVKMFSSPAVPEVASPESPEYQEFDGNFGKNPSRGDYVKGLRESDQTALNTREFVFFSYFQRVRQQLEQAWRPILRSQLMGMYRRGRSPASDREHLTRTLVTLDQKGEIVRIRLVEESGTQDLDDAAVKAFNKAGPFPNPPKGLVEANGLVEIQWQFVLRT